MTNPEVAFRLVQRQATSFEDLVEHGGVRHKLRCADGFGFSVIAHGYAYCSPRPDWPFPNGAPADYEGPFETVELGYPTARPEPWLDWSLRAENLDTPEETVYAYVPVQAVRELIALHGGEV